MDDERRKVTLLIRWVAAFIAIPTLSIGIAMWMWDPKAHAIHMVGFLGLGALAVAGMFVAPRLARRWVKDA